MTHAVPELRWTTRVGFGGGHHPYGGALAVHPFGVIASGGSRGEHVAVVDGDTGQIRFERDALCVGVVGGFAITTQRNSAALRATAIASGDQHDHALPAGERPLLADGGSLFVAAGRGDGGTFCERVFDPVRGAGEVVRVLSRQAAFAARATAELVATHAQVFDRRTGAELGAGERVALAGHDWFAVDAGGLALANRAGTRWHVATAKPIAWDDRVVVATLHAEAELSALAILDRAAGAARYTSPPRRGPAWSTWRTALVCGDYLVVNDQHDERDRSRLHALALDGTPRWQLGLGENAWACDLAIAPGRLYVLACSGMLYGFAV